MTRFLFVGAVFLNAALMFLIQPMVGKVLLPNFGGVPQVWAACLIFFQVLLLAGYLMTHLCLQHFGPGRQAVVHVLLLILAALGGVGLLQQASGEALSSAPVSWSLRLAWQMCGFPFLLLAAGSPLLQFWFVRVSGETKEPYSLFAAGNIGSLGGLLAFPLLIEPAFPLESQLFIWNLAFRLLVVLFAVLAWKVLERPDSFNVTPAPEESSPSGEFPSSTSSSPPFSSSTTSENAALSSLAVVASLAETANVATIVPAAATRNACPAWKWFLLAAVPSALLTAMTVHITTDIAPIPLLWVLPLALYLVSFTIVFARVPAEWSQATVLIGLFAFIIGQRGYFSHGTTQAWGVVFVALFLGFWLFLFFHGELARRAPAPEDMTRFLLTMAAGGATGSLLAGFGPPLLFSGLWEYPLLLMISALLVSRLLPEADSKIGWKRFAGSLSGAALMVWLLARASMIRFPAGWSNVVGAGCEMLLLAFVALFWPRRFGVVFASLLLLGLVTDENADRVLMRARSFFGPYVIITSEKKTIRYLRHGNIVHGGQAVSSVMRDVPILYYYPEGPAGQVLQHFERQRPLRVGVVGMGAGMVAAYSRFGQEYVFFEIDPEVVRLAQNPDWFTYLSDARGKIRVVCGDGRLGLAAEPPGSFDILLFDAYSSDAIPVHLMTREALKLFLTRLKPGGIMFFHLSNRYLRLEPVLGNLCHDLGLAALVQDYDPDEKTLPPSEAGLVSGSRWALAAPASASLAPWQSDPRWMILPQDPVIGVWTDQYSSLLSIFRK